jgi:hypothetical protein
MKHFVSTILLFTLILCLMACGRASEPTVSSPASVATTYRLAAQSTRELAVWLAGDYVPFPDFYTKLEEMEYQLHDVTLKDNQVNFVYDYSQPLQKIESMTGFVKWSVPDQINADQGLINVSVTFEGQGTLSIGDQDENPKISGGADLYTATIKDYRTDVPDNNGDLLKQNVSDAIIIIDETDGNKRFGEGSFVFSETDDNKTLLLVIKVAFNDHYLKIIYFYDKVID